MSRFVLIAAVLIVAVAAWVGYSKYGGFSSKISTQTLGTYAYECDEHVSFTMTPSSDMSSITLAPIGGAYPPKVTLAKRVTNVGARYEGGGVVFVAHGETVTLGEGDSAINCLPTPNPGEAPFNFGD
jgi:membrane-bound inhibitor of C-type lysozyme